MTSSNGSRRQTPRASHLFSLLLVLSAAENVRGRIPTQYSNPKVVPAAFDRASVEAPPYILEDNSPAAEAVVGNVPTFYRQRSPRDTTAFSRASVESGATSSVADFYEARGEPLQFHGAAKPYGAFEGIPLEDENAVDGVQTYSFEKPLSGNRKYDGNVDERSAVESLPQNNPDSEFAIRDILDQIMKRSYC